MFPTSDRAPRTLPQMAGAPFLTDGGIETCLIFRDGIELPDFAAFVLLDDDAGRAALSAYYARYVEVARRDGRGFILESPTWRASADWGARLGYSAAGLDRVNRDAIYFLRSIRNAEADSGMPIVVSGCVGPRGDGYDPGRTMTAEEAAAYHEPQVRALAGAGADMVTAITMTNVPEAIGVARAAAAQTIPLAISFTVETNGALPTGETLGDAVCAVDEATAGWPAYFMVNCAHPSHFARQLPPDEAWTERVRGIRANASRLSHAELDAAEDLDDGDPAELGEEYRALRERLPWITVLGGCCGTDERHIAAISRACWHPGRTDAPPLATGAAEG